MQVWSIKIHRTVYQNRQIEAFYDLPAALLTLFYHFLSRLLRHNRYVPMGSFM